MAIRTLILGTTAAVALFSMFASLGCSPTQGTRAASAPPRAFQAPARAADNLNAGKGYDGGDPVNVNRPGSTPTSVGGGPASEATAAPIGDAPPHAPPHAKKKPE